MQGSAFLDEIEAIDGNDLAVGEKFADDTEGALVIFRLAESRDQHCVIEDEEIDV